MRQLAEEGLALVAGQSVFHVTTNSRAKSPEEKVRAEELLDRETGYDKRRYTEMLVRGASTILQPFGVEESHKRDDLRLMENNRQNLQEVPRKSYEDADGSTRQSIDSGTKT